MRIHLISDLHMEFAKFKYTPPDCDVVILSGDISPGLPGVIWANETYKVPVVYCQGNHEFYGKRSLNQQLAAMKARAAPNVHVLQNETVVIDGVRFIGATLWTDFNLYGQAPMHEVMAGGIMNDYRQIVTDLGTKLTPQHTLREHQQSRLYITTELAKPFEGKTVVVTHHAPSEKSIAPRFAMHPATPAYASNLEQIMLDYKPVLWTHGHMHNNFDYMVGDTRVVCNPRGYQGPDSHEDNFEFDPQMIIEI